MNCRRLVTIFLGLLVVMLLISCSQSSDDQVASVSNDFGALVEADKIVQDPTTGGFYPVNQVLIVFQDNASENSIDEAINSVNGQKAGCITIGGASLYQVILQASSIEELDRAIDELEDNSNVAAVLKNHISASQNGQDGEYDTFSDNVPQAFQMHYQNLALVQAWNAVNEFYGPTHLNPNLVKISAVDSGVDVDHEDLKNDSEKGYQVGGNTSTDPLGHGTGVSGIIAAHNNGAGMNGIMTGVTDANFKYKVNCSDHLTTGHCFQGVASDEITSINDLFMVLFNIKISVENDEADIVNLSLGWAKSQVGEQGFELITGFFSELFKKHPGVLFVCAAGNGADDASGFAPGGFVDEEIMNRIVVGATTGDDDLATAVYPDGGGSNYGETVDIAAPGGYEEIYTTTLDGWGATGGTSAASAIVTGVAGLLKYLDKDLTPQEIKDIFKNNGEDITEGKLSEYNTKRINAYRSVQDVIDMIDSKPSVSLEGFPASLEAGEIYDIILEAKAKEGYTLQEIIFRAADGQGNTRIDELWNTEETEFTKTVSVDTSGWNSGSCEFYASVEDNEGQKKEYENVLDLAGAKPIAEIVKPSAETTGLVFKCDEPVELQGEAATLPGRTINSWKWDMGDGSIVETQNGSHTYTGQGDYDISLTVVDDEGRQSDPATVQVSIECNPTLTLTKPNTFHSFATAFGATIEWKSTGIPADAHIELFVRRDDTAGMTNPDDVNWYIFPCSGAQGYSLNDGEELVVIPQGLQSGNDWRFYARLISSPTVQDSSDETMVISSTGEGSNPRFTSNGDGVIIDNETGLTWLQDPACFQPMNWEDALEAVGKLSPFSSNCNLNDDSSPGDWRLPNRHELLSLIDYNNQSQFYPALPEGNPFRDYFYGSYWTSTTVADSTDSAWWINIIGGTVWKVTKEENQYVWPVRGESAALFKTGQTIKYYAGDDGDLQKGKAWPEPRFVDKGDGTILDKVTGLYWLKDVGCSAINGDYYHPWNPDRFMDGVCGLTDGSQQGDWHYPTIQELELITHKGFAGPPLPDAMGSGRWSEGDVFNGVRFGFDDKGCYDSSIMVKGWEAFDYRYLVNFADSGVIKGGDDDCTVWPVREAE